MVTFRNNNRRPRFRSNDRSFKRVGDGSKYKSDFHTNGDFQRKSLSRNNHNASKLIEKYNDLAREATSNGDKILSENYLQHADHFTRILNEQENIRKLKFAENKSNETTLNSEETSIKSEEINVEEKNDVAEIKNSIKKKTEAS